MQGCILNYLYVTEGRITSLTSKKKERTFGKDWSAQENKGLQFLSVTANEQIVLLPGDTHLSIFLKISV